MLSAAAMMSRASSRATASLSTSSSTLVPSGLDKVGSATSRRRRNAASAAAGLIGRGVGPPGRFDLDFWPVGSASTVDQQLVFFRALLDCGVLPVRVFPCELLTDADLEQVQRAFDHGCKEVARYLDSGRVEVAS